MEVPEIGMTFQLQDTVSDGIFTATEGCTVPVARMVNTLIDSFYYRHVRLNGGRYIAEGDSGHSEWRRPPANYHRFGEAGRVPINLSGVVQTCLSKSKVDGRLLVTSEYLEIDWYPAAYSGEVVPINATPTTPLQTYGFHNLLEMYENHTQGLITQDEIKGSSGFFITWYLVQSEKWKKRPQLYMKGGVGPAKR